MASTITNYSININTAFPTPGVDNDTAGFRNNFSAIKNALNVASSEISVIQQKAITSVDWSIIANKPAFSTVSTSGSYYDLADRPVLNGGTYVPTVVSAFQNDVGYLSTTSVYWANLQKSIGNIQSQTSDITNDNPLDSIEATAISINNSIVQLSTSSLINHYSVGQTLKIFGASTSTTLLSSTGVVNSVTLNGFAGITGSSTLNYKVAQFNLTTGEVSPASSETVISSVNLAQFNLTNNIGVSVTRSSANYGILLYRQSPGGSYDLIAVLGSKDFVGNLNATYLDYYNFDYTSWSKKSNVTNAYQSTTGLIHMPLTAPGSASKGWGSGIITAIDTSTGRISLSSSLYMDSSIIVSHDDTALIQNAINTRTSNNLNSLRLGSKNYIISNVNLPTGFKLYGTSRRTQLKKLAWSANNQNTNKMIGTIDNAVLELISISNIDIDGNMQNQYLLDDTSDAYINYIVDIKGSNHSFDNLIISNVVGGGISSTQPVNLMITNCHIEGGGLSDRDQLSPIVADNGSSLLITNNVLKNFPGNIDVSLSNSGVLNGNIVNNCGSGILIYGSINLVTSANVILGPAGEFIPGPDILNSEFDAVNVTLTSDTDYLSDMYVYQENGSLFNLTTNSGVISYKVEKLRKVNNVEELYGEVVVQDPTTSSISLVCPLFPILNTDFLNGQFKFLITISGVNSLTNYYSYSRLHAIEPNHVGLVYKALLTEYVPSGQVTSATLFNSPPYAHIQVKIPDPQNLAVGSTVRLLGIGASPTVEDVDAIIDHADTINQLYTIKYNTTISNISNVFGSTQLTRKNTFVLVKGRIQ